MFIYNYIFHCDHYFLFIFLGVPNRQTARRGRRKRVINDSELQPRNVMVNIANHFVNHRSTNERRINANYGLTQDVIEVVDLTNQSPL